MEDEGIMALPRGQAMPKAPENNGFIPKVSPEAEAAFEEARMRVDPVEFGDELLNQAEVADPETVAEFRSLLEQISLPPEMIDALGQMVDTILDEPEKYQEIRARFIQEGIPPNLLPRQFDAAFFGALNMALDQLSADLGGTPQGFAYGGAVNKTPIASDLAKMGRKGDTQLAHITMSEARMLRRKGGSGTINPSTGLPEYFLDKVFKSVGKVFKKVGNAVKNVVNGVVDGVKKFAKSTVGRIITTIALGFFLGPAAASFLGVGAGSVVGSAISGFVGGFGSSLLAGDDVKTALRNGTIGGITAGAASGVTGSSFYSPSTQTAGEALSGQWNKFTEGIASLGKPPEAAPPSDLVAKAQEGALPKPIEPPTPDQFMASNQQGVNLAKTGPTGTVSDVSAGTTGPIAPEMNLSDVNRIGMNQGLRMPAGGANLGSGLQAPGQLGSGLQAGPGQVLPATSFKPGPMGITEGLTSAAQNIGAGQYGQAASNLGDVFFGTTPRMVGTTLGTLALTGGFNTEPPTPPNILPKETGEDLLRKEPEKYSVTPGGAVVTYGGYGGRGFANGGIAAVSPRRFNMGGFAGYKRGGIMSQYPRRTGAINGPGTGTSDSIPAMLSDGEFVFTAKAVRGAGKGSRKEGARRMYAMMKALERKS